VDFHREGDGAGSGLCVACPFESFFSLSYRQGSRQFAILVRHAGDETLLEPGKND
jgi:hypothetical protein